MAQQTTFYNFDHADTHSHVSIHYGTHNSIRLGGFLETKAEDLVGGVVVVHPSSRNHQPTLTHTTNIETSLLCVFDSGVWPTRAVNPIMSECVCRSTQESRPPRKSNVYIRLQIMYIWKRLLTIAGSGQVNSLPRADWR